MKHASTTTASALELKLSAFFDLTKDEMQVLRLLQAKKLFLDPNKILIDQDDVGDSAYILWDGWACAYKDTADGARQIIDFRIPGDFIGQRRLLLHTSDLAFLTIGEVVASKVTYANLAAIFTKSSRLALALLWAASRDEAMVAEHLVNIGRRDALTRTAYYLLLLGQRLRLVGRATATGYDCPLTQYHLADALGLTAIHLNRCLRKLRDLDLLIFRDGTVAYLDLPKLQEMTGFDMALLTGPQGQGAARQVMGQSGVPQRLR